MKELEERIVKDGGWKPEEFARFNSPECVLCDFEPECAVAVSGERLTAKILFANSGEKDYANAVAKWTLRTAAGEELLRGETAAGDQPAGPVRAAGTSELTMPEPAASSAASAQSAGTVTSCMLSRPASTASEV